MEKLILRSVMYGADKIPDSWFEKVPGGFYRTKEGKAVAAKQQAKRDSNNSGSRPSTGDSRNGGRSRRHSFGDGPSPNDGYRDDGYRSGGPPRRGDREQRQRESYDGMEEGDGSYSGDDRRRRRNHGSSRRRRSFEDDPGYNYGTGPPPSRDDRRDERRYNDGAPYPERDFGPTPRHPGPYGPVLGAAAVTGAGMGMATGASTPASSTSHSAQPAPTGRAGIAGSYVPYANIYGAPAPPTHRETPPQSSAGSARPTDKNHPGHRVAPPPSHYQQNPYAQDTADGAAQSGYPSQDSGYSSRYELRNDDRYSEYDEQGRPYSSSPQRQHTHSRRDEYSPSYGSRADGERRVRPEQRDGGEGINRSKFQGGGRARERYVPPGYQANTNATSSPATGTMKPVDPRQPLSAQFGCGEPGGRKEDERAGKHFGSDGANGKRTSGYYSD